MTRHQGTLAVMVALVSAIRVQAAPPAVTWLYPAGARAGDTVQVTAGGTFGRWPVRAWCDRADVSVRPGKDKGQLEVAVSPGAVPGVCWIRLADEEGATALRPFVVGTLPEVLEVEPNDEPGKPQVLPRAGVTVNGRLGRAGDVDGFAVPLKKGQTLAAALQAHEGLGSPMDAVVQVLAPGGAVLAQNHDARGLDPLATATAAADGTYLVRVFAFPSQPDSTIGLAGGEAYVYRLTLTTEGIASHAWPLAVPAATGSAVAVRGWNVPAGAGVVPVPAGEPSARVVLAAKGAEGTVEVRRERHATVIETEPNGPDKAQTVAVPATVSGGIDPAGDRDVYAFAGKKGQKLVLHLEAGSLGSLLDPLLVVRDAAGKEIGRGAPAGPGGARLEISPAADGELRAEIRDLLGLGGWRHYYRLRIAPPEPDWSMSVAADRFTLVPGTPLEVPVTVERTAGFAGAISIQAEGLPEGVAAAAVESQGTGPTAAKVTLRLTGSGKPASGLLRIVGRAAGEPGAGKSAQAPAGEPFGRTPHLWLTVTSAPAKPAVPAKK